MKLAQFTVTIRVKGECSEESLDEMTEMYQEKDFEQKIYGMIREWIRDENLPLDVDVD